MSHDPLCPELWRWNDGQPCMFCALITRVRENERWRDDDYRYVASDLIAQGSIEGYARALRDVMEVIDRFDDSNEYPLIVAAIKALGNER